MDLLICPSCKQSVLDDEATTCPFCGAAMDGSDAKPAASAASTSRSAKKPAEKSAAKPAATAGAKAAERPATAAPAKAKSEPDDPFAVKSKASKQAIPLRAKPTAKTTYRVVCPMCDTNGFATPAVAGKEVKCPNPKCLMPVFTAPEIKKEAPPEPKKPLLTPAVLAGIFLLLVAAGGGIFYVVVLQDDASPSPTAVTPFVPSAVTQTPEENEATEETPVPQAAPKTPLPELEAQILASGIASAQQRNDNRSKETCRELTAEAFAVRGKVQEALGQLQSLDNLRSGLDFLKITPLTQIGWYHLQRGDRAAAEQVVDQAMKFSAKLPQTGPDAVQHAVALGTILVALDRFDDARTLVETREQLQDVAQSAARVSMIIHDHSFNLADSYRWLPRVELNSPLMFAVSYGATTRGYSAQVEKWIATQTNVNRRSACAAAWAAGEARLAQAQKSTYSAQKLQQLTDLSEADRLRALAMALQISNRADADQNPPAILAELQQAVAAQSVPAAFGMPEFRQIYEGNFQTAPRESEINMQTHLLLARYFASHNQTDAAWEQFQKVLDWLAATAPTQATVKPLIERLERDRVQIQSQLGQELNLTTEESRRSAFNQYRKNARQLEEEARKRQDLETRVLTMALDWGMAKPLYQSYQTQSASTSNLSLVIETSLIPELIFALKTAGDEASARQLSEKWTTLANNKTRLQMLQQLERLINVGHVTEAHNLLKASAISLNEPLLHVRLACQLAEKASPETVAEWVSAIPDVLDQELAFRLTAAQMTHRGLFREHWKAATERSLSATDKCSLNLGLMEGLSTTAIYQPELTPPASEPAKAADKNT